METSRGDAAVCGHFAEMSRGDATAATWIFREDESRRRRGCDADIPWGSRRRRGCDADIPWASRRRRDPPPRKASAEERVVDRRYHMLPEIVTYAEFEAQPHEKESYATLYPDEEIKVKRTNLRINNHADMVGVPRPPVSNGILHGVSAVLTKPLDEPDVWFQRQGWVQ